MSLKIPKPSKILKKGSKIAADLEKKVANLEGQLADCEKASKTVYKDYLRRGRIIQALKKELGK